MKFCAQELHRIPDIYDTSEPYGQAKFNLVNPFDMKWLTNKIFLACFSDLEAVSIIHTFLKPNRFLNQKWPKNKIKYAKINSKIISDIKYILLFHISSWCVRFVFLYRGQLKEIDSICIIFGEKSNFLKKRFIQICEKWWRVG